ncbi:MAG: hypothetical protein AAFW83_10375 [Pseudomonadota bacterium]
MKSSIKMIAYAAIGTYLAGFILAATYRMPGLKTASDGFNGRGI